MRSLTTSLLLLSLLGLLATSCRPPRIEGSITIPVTNQAGLPQALFDAALEAANAELAELAPEGVTVTVEPSLTLRGEPAEGPRVVLLAGDELDVIRDGDLVLVTVPADVDQAELAAAVREAVEEAAGL